MWRLESRILTVTAHALIESIVGYGLATTGSHAGIGELREIDARYLDRVARRVVGTNMTMRTETLMILADTAGMINHFVLKCANVLDRTLRAGGTAAQENAWKVLQRHYEQDPILMQKSQ